LSESKPPPHCNKCNCPYTWDKLAPTPTYSKRYKDGTKNGWWIESSSKEEHTQERCARMKQSNEWPELQSGGDVRKGDNRGNTLDGNSISVGHNSQPLTQIDQQVKDKIIQNSYVLTQLLAWKLEGVEKACKEMNITNGATIGMLFNAVMADERNAKYHE